jgi:uncharacterized protein DUF6424
MAVSTHTESENDPWTIDVGDHPARADSVQYTHSRALMIKLVQTTQPWYLGDKPYQDHHGGGIWVKDAAGWLLILGLAGIEWSAQFCADPVKVDVLRQQANRILAGFPGTVAAYEALGYHDAAGLLASPITDPDSVAAWTDGVFNASVPLPADRHTGVLPKGGGFHHYPKPIVDIELFKFDDFTLWVTDATGQQVAVTPVGHRGSGDGRTALAWAPHNHAADAVAGAVEGPPAPTILPADSDLSKQAFALQT